MDHSITNDSVRAYPPIRDVLRGYEDVTKNDMAKSSDSTGHDLCPAIGDGEVVSGPGGSGVDAPVENESGDTEKMAE